jgi:hypothetical protein
MSFSVSVERAGEPIQQRLSQILPPIACQPAGDQWK